VRPADATTAAQTPQVAAGTAARLSRALLDVDDGRRELQTTAVINREEVLPCIRAGRAGRGGVAAARAISAANGERRDRHDDRVLSTVESERSKWRVTARLSSAETLRSSSSASARKRSSSYSGT
jgi:hypothetical protein